MGPNRTAVLAVLALAFATAPARSDPSSSLTGPWRATASVKGVDVPFQLGLNARAGVVRATFYDGPRPNNPSAPGTLSDGRLHLTFPSFNAVLDATVSGDTLDGVYTLGHSATPVHAVKGSPLTPSAARAPPIAGEWIIPHPNSKREQAWRLIVHQDGGRVQAAILRVDGDTGTLDGVYRDGVFRVSHFGDNRAAVLEMRPAPEHRLKLLLTDDDDDDRAELIAVRPAEAKAQGVAPADPTRYSGVKDPEQPFAFAFDDLAGHRVANTDPRFHGKVIVLDVMGSWCPNCHDEAPFLEQLYKARRQQGLEIVALDFENTGAPADMARLNAFIQRYGLTYTVLYGGLRKDVREKLPQAENLAAWPTTFFIGRDGRVKATHVGFTSAGSGPADLRTKAEVNREVAELLAQPAPR